MKKALKWIAIVIGLLIVIGILIPSDDKPGSSNSSNTEKRVDEPTAPKQYVEVFSFKGNGMKKSPNFHLSGGNARIVYDYGGDMYGGLFSVYVVDKGVDIMRDGGIPEVMIQQAEKSESYIQKSEGDYYLEVNATGNWSVSVEEEK